MNLNRETFSGVKWTSSSSLVLAVFGLLKISVLARFLNPSDFGLMALVTFVLGIMNLFMDMGLTSAILHKQNISQKEYASLYWVNIIFSLCLFAFLYFVSPLIGSFYGEPELNQLIPLMAYSIVLSALGRQFKTVEQKKLRFKYIAITEIIGATFGFSTAFFFAVNNYGVYTLVYSSLIQYTTVNAIYFINGCSTYGILFHFCFKEVKPFLKIGVYQVGGQLLNYFNRDLDILLIGKFFGSEILGGYSLAKQLVQYPMQLLNPIVSRVSAPILALTQDDYFLLKDKFLNFLNIVSTTNIFAYGFLALFSYPIVSLLYGVEYTYISTIVKILSIYMYFRSVASIIGSLVIATGKTYLEFNWNFFVLFITPFFIYIGALVSIEMVAFALVMVTILLFIPSWFFLIYKLCGATLKEYSYNYIPRLKSLWSLINISRG